MIKLFAFVLAIVSLSTAFAQSRTNPPSQRLCFISDLNGSYGTIAQPQSVHTALRELTQLNCGLVVGAGDLVAGQDPSLTESRLRSMWDEFQRVVLTPLDNLGVPLLSALGNHDASASRSASGGYAFERERAVASEFWAKRRIGAVSSAVEWWSQEHYPFFYSVRFGTTGLVFIDGSSATEIRSKRAWLENQLAQMEANPSISSRIVVGHLPLVAVARGRDRAGEILADSRELYQLFDRYKVDLYVSGHHHAFYPGRVEEWSPLHGTVQIALGALGDGPRTLLGNHSLPPRNTLTYIDINESMPSLESRFSVNTLFPGTGTYLTPRSLPEYLPSLDGAGKPVPLKRFDFNSLFPLP